MRTTIIETQTFSDAAVMVEACHTELVRAGFDKEADTIRGVEIFSTADAMVALATLRGIKLTGNITVDSAVRYAAAAVESALSNTYDSAVA